MIVLRDYQEEIIKNLPENGKFLICLATGLGKTVLFSRIPRRGRVLILSHRQELVNQPLKYYECKTGIEMGEFTSDKNDDVVSACVPSFVNRYKAFAESEFDIIIVDEAHHSTAKSYLKIINYFKPRLLLGFTATPKRNDGIRLCDVYDYILADKNIKWGIENGYLSDIRCLQVNIGYDLSSVGTALGDYVASELSNAMDGKSEAIADVYKNHAVGATLVFCDSVEHCHELAVFIPGSIVVSSQTKEREKIIEKFTNGEIKCLINCMIFTEGTDLPFVETVIIARPTKNISLYTQMVGRGVRLHKNKPFLTLIDCVGVSNLNMCRAGSLLGFDVDLDPSTKKETETLKELEKRLFELSNTPIAWVNNIKAVDLWGKMNNYDFHNVNYWKDLNGNFILKLKGIEPIEIQHPTVLGKTFTQNGNLCDFQKSLDNVYSFLLKNHIDKRNLWDTKIIKRWSKENATKKQLDFFKTKKIDIDESIKINRGSSSLIITGFINSKSKNGTIATQ